MLPSGHWKTWKNLLLASLFFLSLAIPSAKAAGVTVITHGLNSDANGWVTGMAEQIPRHPGFPGTNYTIYKIYFNYDSLHKTYQPAWTWLAGSAPTSTDSGEIIVAFDWSQLSSGSNYSTYQVAGFLATNLLSTNFISELNGHALCELPIHLIGHSRGGSLMCQTSLLLGTNNVWVDHLTTLDPHPLNNDEFTGETFYKAVDAPCKTYQTVLFHDNYWQNLDTFAFGEPVAGAYVRQLSDLSGGYQNTGENFWDHSNVHLWYHGTVDFDNPATDLDPANPQITTNERTNWWDAYEKGGTNAGFLYSLIGHGNRTSTDIPLGLPSDPQVVSGYNQSYDLGGGTNANRTALPANNGLWPDIIRFNITGAGQVAVGSLLTTKLYYQYGGASNLTLQFFLDRDFNPWNTNSVLVGSLQPPATGTGSVAYYASLSLPATNVTAGTYALFARISDGVHIRFLYAPETVQITPPLQPPTLDIQRAGSGQMVVGINGLAGQKIVLQISTNLQTWIPLGTNTLSTTRWTSTNPPAGARQFYRAVLSQ